MSERGTEWSMAQCKEGKTCYFIPSGVHREMDLVEGGGCGHHQSACRAGANMAPVYHGKSRHRLRVPRNQISGVSRCAHARIHRH